MLRLVGWSDTAGCGPAPCRVDRERRASLRRATRPADATTLTASSSRRCCSGLSASTMVSLVTSGVPVMSAIDRPSGDHTPLLAPGGAPGTGRSAPVSISISDSCVAISSVPAVIAVVVRQSVNASGDRLACTGARSARSRCVAVRDIATSLTSVAARAESVPPVSRT